MTLVSKVLGVIVTSCLYMHLFPNNGINIQVFLYQTNSQQDSTVCNNPQMEALSRTQDLLHAPASSGLGHVGGDTWVVCQLGFADSGKTLVAPEGFTPPFASPEVLYPWVLKLAGDPVPHSDFAVIATAADVWSAGVVLFFILTSTLPFEADSDACQYIPTCLGPETERVQWAEWDKVRQSHGSWVSSFASMSAALLIF